MSFFSLLLLALALSMDAFAVSLSRGAGLKVVKFRDALRTGLIFGVIEGVTPLAGWGLGFIASGLLVSWSHWLAFILLVLLGVRMIYASWRNSRPVIQDVVASGHSLWLLIITAIATSIDALAIGIGLALLQVNIFQTALIIGCVCAILSTLGMLSGRLAGCLLGKWAEMAGGVVLIVTGCQILFSHVYG